MNDQYQYPEGWKPMRIGGFIGLAGPLLKEITSQEPPRFAFQTTEEHCNPIGLIHGGVLTTLLDQVIALAAVRAADNRPTVTVQLGTRFLGAARAGDLLIAQAVIRNATRSLIFADAEVVTREKPLALATAVMKITAQPGQAK